MDFSMNQQNNTILMEHQTKQMTDAIVERLVAYRKELHITQQDIADQTGIKRANIARLESKKHAITLDSLMKYAKCLNMEISLDLKQSNEATTI